MKFEEKAQNALSYNTDDAMVFALLSIRDTLDVIRDAIVGSTAEQVAQNYHENNPSVGRP